MIELNWTIFLQFANFLLLLLVLNFLLYRPFRRILRERQQAMDGSYQRARDLEEQVNQKMASYQQQLQEAKLKGHQERLQLRQKAMEEEGRLLGENRSRATDQIQAIRSQVAEEMESARRALKSQTETLAGQIAGKVLGRSI